MKVQMKKQRCTIFFQKFNSHLSRCNQLHKKTVITELLKEPLCHLQQGSAPLYHLQQGSAKIMCVWQLCKMFGCVVAFEGLPTYFPT